MAEVASNPTFDEWMKDKDVYAFIEDYLAYLFTEWSGIPDLAAEWHEWDEPSRLTFDVNWGVVEDRLATLAYWHAKGLLTAQQCTRYEQLLRLVDEQRPTLERLLAE